MKVKNIKYSALAYYSNGNIKHRFFVTEQAKDRWCNAQYSVDNDVTVEVYDFETDELYETWHA